MAVDKSRIVEIGSKKQSPAGTGYLIGGRLALTAAHVVPTDGTSIALRAATSDEWVPCSVVWRDDELDAALLEQPNWNVARTVRCGTLVGSQQVDCTLTGFPEFARDENGAEIEQLTGQINPLSGSAPSGWVIRGDFPRDLNALAGLSGAPVFVGDFLVGLVREYSPASGRLLALRTERLGRSDAFLNAFLQHSGVPFVPEAVELVGILNPPIPRRGPVSVETVLEAPSMAVPFLGHADALARLEEWCAGPGLAVCVCTAPPGFGKTRLSLELAKAMAQRGWAAGTLRDLPVEHLGALAQLQAPALLVIDDADEELLLSSWSQTLDEIATRVNSPVRILLLTQRTVYDRWWDDVRRSAHTQEAQSALASVLTVELPPLGLEGRRPAFEHAVPYLARLLKNSLAIAGLDAFTDLEEIASPPLDDKRYESFAAVQAAALRTMLAHIPEASELLTAVRQYEERLGVSIGPDTSAPALPQAQPDPDEQGSLSTRGFGDRPADADLLEREAVVNAITDLLAPPDTAEQPGETPVDTSGPTVVALEGPWGSGKTTMMRLVNKELSRRHTTKPPPSRWPWWHWWPRNRKHLSVISALWILHRADSKKPWKDNSKKPRRHSWRWWPKTPSGLPQKHLWRWWPRKPTADPSTAPVTAHFNPWAHQSNEQIWAGLTRAIIEAARPVLGSSGRARERYWLYLNRLRLDRRRLLGALWRNLTSPLLRLAVFALLPPLVAQLVKADQTYTVWPGHWKLSAPKLALCLPAALLAMGLVHTLLRLFGRARSFLPGDLFDGPVLSGALAPGMGSTADSALRDPYYNARSGYLYLVQHDIKELLASLKERGRELIVFIDDLDRCTPGTTAQVFEAINVFLSGALQATATGEEAPATSNRQAQCRFVIGLDPAVVAGHLDQAYKDLQPERSRPPNGDPTWGWTFLRKLIQLPVTLPPVTETGIDTALEGLLGSLAEASPSPDGSATTAEPSTGPTGPGDLEHGTNGSTAGSAGATTTDPGPVPQLQIRIDPGADADLGADATLRSTEQVRALETNPMVRSLIRQRLGDQGDLSIREAKRLLTIWQFYLRVIGHKERGAKQLSVDQARHLLIVAEIAARWPALQPCLRRPVDGHPGLYWLALGAEDDQAWAQARERTGLSDKHHNHVSSALRALLQEHDGEQVAAVVSRL